MALLILVILILFRDSVCLSRTSKACSDSLQFKKQPEDVTVYEGDDAFFICKVLGYNTETDSLTWLINPGISSPAIFRSYNKSARELTSVLSIFNILNRNGYTQQCMLSYFNSYGTIKTCYSRIGRTNVRYFPRSNEIECGPHFATSLNENDSQKIWCRVQRGNPEVKMTWESKICNSSVLMRRDTRKNDEITSVLDLKIDHHFHEKSITCTIRSESTFPTAEISCTVGPFPVLYRPKLSLTPERISLMIDFEDDEHVHINCTGDGNPHVERITWLCLPPMDICVDRNTYMSRTVNFTTSSLNMLNTTNILITCSASNTVGTANATSIITLRNKPKTETSKPFCMYKSMELNVVDESQFIKIAPNDYTVSLECSVYCNDSRNGSILLRWFYDGMNVKEELLFVILGSTRNKSVLTLKKPTRLDEKKIVVCEVSRIHDHNGSKHRNIVSQKIAKLISPSIIMEAFNENYDRDIVESLRPTVTVTVNFLSNMYDDSSPPFNSKNIVYRSSMTFVIVGTVIILLAAGCLLLGRHGCTVQ